MLIVEVLQLIIPVTIITFSLTVDLHSKNNPPSNNQARNEQYFEQSRPVFTRNFFFLLSSLEDQYFYEDNPVTSNNQISNQPIPLDTFQQNPVLYPDHHDETLDRFGFGTAGSGSGFDSGISLSDIFFQEDSLVI
jgi:hypothetical protein